MPSDKTEYRRALEKREQLLSENRLSLPPSLGATAIMYSTYVIGDSEADQTKQLEAFHQEALALSLKRKYLGKRSRIIKGITPSLYDEHIAHDPEITDVVLIGHGNFSMTYSDNPEDDLEWQDIAAMSDHLKQGYFAQRMCGRFDRDLSVPLGAFAVTSMANIIAAPGAAFSPEIDPDDERKLQNITHKHSLTYQDIKRLFPKEPDHRPSESQVVSHTSCISYRRLDFC